MPGRTLPVRIELVRQLQRRRTQIVFGLIGAAAGGTSGSRSPSPLPVPRRTPVTLVDLAKGSGGQLRGLRAVRPGRRSCWSWSWRCSSATRWRRRRRGRACATCSPRPFPRSRLVRQKAIVAAFLSLAAVLLLPLVALLVGALAYGTGDLVSPTGESLTFVAGAGRVLLGAVYVAVYLSWTAALALLLSVSTDAPLGAVGGAVLV